MAGQTANLRIPYPTGTDRVADGDNAMQALAERVDARLPWGWVGYAQAVANEAGFAGTSTQPMNGLSVTVTHPANRRIRLSTKVQVEGTAAATWYIRIMTGGGATMLTQYSKYIAVNGISETVSVSVIAGPTVAGSATYFTGLMRVLGTGPMNSYASVDNPAFLLVEDIGPWVLTG